MHFPHRQCFSKVKHFKYPYLEIFSETLWQNPSFQLDDETLQITQNLSRKKESKVHAKLSNLFEGYLQVASKNMQLKHLNQHTTWKNFWLLQHGLNGMVNYAMQKLFLSFSQIKLEFKIFGLCIYH